MNKVVIVDCNRNGLASIRSLGRKGVYVIAADHGRTKAGIYSKYVRGRYFLPKPHVDPKGFADRLMEIAEREGSGHRLFLLPVNDEYVKVCAEHWGVLKNHYEALFETDVGMLDTIGNKLMFSEFSAKSGVPQPKRYWAEDVEKGDVSFPIIIKPDERRSVENLTKGVFKVRYCEDRTKAQSALGELARTDTPAIIQQFIPGGDDTLYTAGVCAVNGSLVACFTGRKVRQFPPKAGQATLAESIDHPLLVPYAKKIVEELGFTGVAQIEFKAYEQELYVIEMNPRSWSWHGLAQKAGVDLPYLLYETIATGERSEGVVTNAVNGLTWYYFLEDLVYNRLMHKSVSWREMWSSFKTASAHAFFDAKDILPWLVHSCVDVPLRLSQYFFGRKRKIDTE